MEEGRGRFFATANKFLAPLVQPSVQFQARLQLGGLLGESYPLFPQLCMKNMLKYREDRCLYKESGGGADKALGASGLSGM